MLEGEGGALCHLTILRNANAAYTSVSFMPMSHVKFK